MVMVYLVVEIFAVGHDHGRPVRVEVKGSIYGAFKLPVVCCKSIEIETLIALRLFQVHVDLACDRLIAIHNAGSSLRHADRLHPWARDVGQAKRLTKSANAGHVLKHQLAVSAGKSKHLNLLCSRHGIAVIYVHRHVGFKRLCQVTACCTLHFTARDHIGQYRIQTGNMCTRTRPVTSTSSRSVRASNTTDTVSLVFSTIRVSLR